jgi:hypothetical protein
VRKLAPALASLTLLAVAAASSTAAPAPRPLETAIVDPWSFAGSDAEIGLSRAKAAGASKIKVPLFWNAIAPTVRRAGFDPADPEDPAYAWTHLDTQLRLVRAHGLEPIVYIAGAPRWANRQIGGVRRADPEQYADFTMAAVRRYSGQTAGLPRVRYWQAWNEPNKVVKPRFKLNAASWYRDLVNAFAASVHSEPGNAVVAGGLSPFGISTAVAPLAFMRSLLCVPSGRSAQTTCSDRVHFDIWAAHPYTAGGPAHHAYRPNDVSLGDLPEMKAVLDAAVLAGRVVSKERVRLWVTEFSWDSSPPDPAGVPAKLQGRWVAEALYRMWSAGVSLVTWFTLRDHPTRTSPYQAGLYFRGASIAGDSEKPAYTAFRFPFVAFTEADPPNVVVWGRTPGGVPGTVVVEQYVASGWEPLVVLSADRVGIFSAELRAKGRGSLRARLPGEGATSLPFSLVRPPDRIYQPFGS